MTANPSCQPATDRGNKASSRINSLQLNVQNLLHGNPLRSSMSRLASPKFPKPGFLRSRSTYDEENVALTRPSVDVLPQLATPTFSFMQESAAESRASNVDSAAESLSRSQTDLSTWRSASHEANIATAARLETDRHRAFKQRVKTRQKSAWVRNKADRPKFFSCIGSSSPRRKLIMCAIFGSILTITLTTYLGIALTSETLGQPVHVIFILVILLITVFFCHSLIRLCMHLLRPSSAVRNRNRVPSLSSPDGFNPDEPIRVHVVTDREIAGADHEDNRWMHDSKGLVAPPPAYGLWRSSVRVNPSLLHWQRTEESNAAEVDEPVTQPLAEGGTIRPPSYLSDEGVEYVLRATPRSTVHTTPISQARSDGSASFSTMPTPAVTRETTRNVAPHPGNQYQRDQHSSHLFQPPITQGLNIASVSQPPRSPPAVAAATYTPHTTSSFYSEHTPPVVQAPDFGASLAEQMLLHPAYRT